MRGGRHYPRHSSAHLLTCPGAWVRLSRAGAAVTEERKRTFMGEAAPPAAAALQLLWLTARRWHHSDRGASAQRSTDVDIRHACHREGGEGRRAQAPTKPGRPAS